MAQNVKVAVAGAHAEVTGSRRVPTVVELLDLKLASSKNEAQSRSSARCPE
jgi:hypothetical protein